MAAVIESYSVVNAASLSSLVFTKPTGLAVGDLMAACLITSDDGASTAATPTLPSGWTSYATYTSVTTMKMVVYLKIADSSDVAASTFTFTGVATGDYSGGTLFRISGAPILSGYDIHETASETTDDTTANFTCNLSVAFANSIVIMVLLARDSSTTDGTTGYTISGTNPTWTQYQDDNVQDTDFDHQFSIAAATISDLRTITSFSATWGGSHALSYGLLLYIPSTTNATGSNALLQTDPTFFSGTATAGTTGSNALLEVAPEFSSPSGRATQQIWTNEASVETTWTNESL